jgi:hypothetical protein
MKRWLMPIACLPLLAGCFQDTASYSLGARDHAITLVRNQTFPWQSTVDVSVIAVRMPECNGGGDIKGIPEDAEYALYRAPDEYPEPIFLLKADDRVFAVSTQSCRLQEFEDAPDQLGEKLGTFKVKDDKFQFVEGE